MTSNSHPKLVVENDSFLRLIQVILDPNAPAERFAAFHRALLDRGVYLAPSQFEAAFLSLAHSPDDVAATVAAAAAAL